MRFSIVIPTYNYAEYLPHALASVFAQAGDDDEVIVVDDGSTDDTAEVIKPWYERFEERLIYLYQDNQGPSAARNLGIEQACGDYVVLLDADDRLLPRALALFRDFLGRLPDTDMVFGGHISVSADGMRKTKLPPTMTDNKARNFRDYIKGRFRISNGSAAIRRSVYARVNYPADMRNNEDMVVDGQILALFTCRSFAEPVVEIHDHGGRLRHNLAAIRDAGLGVVDRLFDPAVLPGQLMDLRDVFLANRLLSRFRSYYLAGEYGQANRLYWQAVMTRPASLLSFSYLKKYMRSALLRWIRSPQDEHA